MTTITLDATAWRQPADIWRALLPALGAPAWHGHSLDALYDSLVADLNERRAPLSVEVVHADSVPREVRDYMVRIGIVFTDARAHYHRDVRFHVVDARSSISPAARP